MQGGLWSAKVIAQAFKEKKLVKNIMPCLERIKQVPKSSIAKRGERPTVNNHYDSFKVNGTLFSPTKITLIDDVLTKGSTMYAAARKIKEAYPNVEVKAFAVIRTMGLQASIEKIVDPSIGKITFDRHLRNCPDL